MTSSTGEELTVVTRRYWPVLALSFSPDNKLTPLQMQKALFLIGQNLPAFVGANYYDFKPYNYGPFDATIYRDLDESCDEGFVALHPVPDRDWSEYEITRAGVELAERVGGSLSEGALDYIDRVVVWTRSTPFADLLGAIYREYPKYAAKSLFNIDKK